ncbi:MAG TPA: polyprenol monophosphomannose synthase [Acidimicrobiia bacterium]|nr:polyprenol monophosphomannose synthase [Acidimicrobiia bacterium]
MRPDEVTVVVPTYNEIENLEPLVKAVLDHGYRVLIVDDGSPDGTGAMADRLAAVHQLVEVLHRPVKEGLGPAYAVGFEHALANQAHVICEMDADFSHDPADLSRLVDAVESDNADLAIGSRYVPGGSTPDWPFPRRALSRGGNLYARFMLGLGVSDATAGFRAYRARSLVELDAATCRASGYGFQVELAWRATTLGLRIVEVPIVFRDRVYGESKMKGRIVAEAMWLVTKWGMGRVFGRRGAGR